MNNFRKKVEILKQLNHQHIIKIKLSYTDTECIIFLMFSLTNCDLEKYLINIENVIKENERERRITIHSFFNYLINTLTYLHQSSVQNQCIKSKNILMHQSQFLLTDFDMFCN